MRTVAITGGAQGIGRAAAISFAKAGYAVSLADIHKEAGFEVIRRIREFGGKAFYMNVDISDEEAVSRWIKLIVEDWGRLDVLINNAGIGYGGSMLEIPLSAFDRVIAVNLRGTFLCSRHAAHVMKDQGAGVILNLASTRAFMSEADTEAYSASKGGIAALTHAMAVSLGQYGIRVNAISPGWIETGPWQYSPNAHDPEHTERDKLQHPAGRVGTPEDIAEMLLYLAGEKAGFITGQNIVIDGGMTVKMIYE